MAKVGRRWERARWGKTPSRLQSAGTRSNYMAEVGLQIALESCPVTSGGIMDSGINETAAGAII